MRHQIHKGLLALAVVVAACCLGSSAQAQEAGCTNCGTANAGAYPTFGNPDLFYNYYTQGYANQAAAAMYPSPRPVPAWVGQTYYTYQPLYPQEMMYWHKDRYHRYYDDSRGLNRTSVHYYSPPVRTGASMIYGHFRIPR